MCGNEFILADLSADIEQVRPNGIDVILELGLQGIQCEPIIFDQPEYIDALNIQFELLDGEHAEVEYVIRIIDIEYVRKHDLPFRSNRKE